MSLSLFFVIHDKLCITDNNNNNNKKIYIKTGENISSRTYEKKKLNKKSTVKKLTTIKNHKAANAKKNKQNLIVLNVWKKLRIH